MQQSTSHLSLQVREEIANITLHSFGLFLSLVGFGVLVGLATLTGSVLQVVGSSVYAVTLAMVYVASILFHTSLAIHLSWKKAFETLDHCAIYLLIAGTYTPFLLNVVHGKLAWIMLIVIWSLAVLGILYKVFFFYRSNLLSTLAYIAMGWLSLLIVKPLIGTIGWSGVGMLVLGGVLYTVGAIFYLWDHKFHFAHAVWHSFVLAGSTCHYLTVIWFVIQK